MGPSPTFLSPRDQRGRVGLGVRGDDLRPDPRGMVFDSPVNLKQAEGYIPHHAGPPGQYGLSVQFPPLGTYLSPPYQGSYMVPPSGAY
jgi:hypothetical protein